jgi:hypothetical protein
MKKTAFYTLLVVALLLAGCGSGAQYAAAPEEPMMEMAADSYGGGFDEGNSVGRAFAEAEESTAFNGAGVSAAPVERMVIKNADLSVVVLDPVEKMDAIAAMAEEMGGFVVNSNVWQNTLSNGAKVPHASISIRVPAERLEEALERIKTGVGEILSENVSGQDVTSEYTDLSSRLRNLEAAEAQLQEIMDEATKTEDVLQVYNNLVNVREQIEVIKGQMQYYEQAAAMSMISVDISGDEEAQPLQIGGWQPGGVAKDAIETMVDTLQWLGNVAIWVGLCVLPIGIIVGIPLFFAGRAGLRFRRRRKVAKVADEPASFENDPENSTED